MMPENELYPPTKSRTVRNEQQRSEKVLQEFVEQNPKIAAEVYRGRELQGKNALPEDVSARALGKSALVSSSEWADAQVVRQLDGMGTSRFELGVLTADKAKGKQMSLQVLEASEVIQAAANLRRLNAAGADIHIRPKEAGGYSLSLVDDISESTIARMKQQGYTPAVVVRTSPNNYQAWMRHGEALSAEASYAAGKALAEKFGSDIGAAPAGHMGRLVGTTNRKEKYETAEGKFPWVVATEASGKVYEVAPEFVAEVKRQMVIEANQRYEKYQHQGSSGKGHLKSIEDFRQDARYAGDGNRVDFAYAMYARGKDVDRREVAAAIATRDLSHKANNYVEYTIRRAEEKIGQVKSMQISA